jgi:hypothetical protein
MKAGLMKHIDNSKIENLIWEIEISDLGATRPFLGFSFTNQYILVGITAPDLQRNHLSIVFNKK